MYLAVTAKNTLNTAKMLKRERNKKHLTHTSLPIARRLIPNFTKFGLGEWP